MPDYATREDLQEATERLITRIHAFMNRVDEQFAKVNQPFARVDEQVRPGQPERRAICRHR